MKVVHLDEVVEVDTQQFESYHQVLAEHKLVKFLYYIFLIVRIFFVKCLDQVCFDEALLVEPLLVLKHLECNEFLLLVIENPDHYSEGAFTQFLNHFVTVVDMIVIAHCILLLIRVEAIVGCLVYAAPFHTSNLLGFLTFPSLSLLNIEVVNGLVVVNFLSFIFG